MTRMKAPVIPTEMRAAVLLGPDAHLSVMTIPVPRPRAGEVLIRVAACGVCHTDLHVMKSEVAFPRPAVLGHEVSGVVVELGDGSGPFAVGDAVVGAFIMPCGECAACLRGRDDLCAPFFALNRLRGTLYDGESRLRMPDDSFLAMYSMGGLAEYSVVPVLALTPAPKEVELALACILGCAGLTSYSAVFRAGQIEPGNSVAIVGVGGIGSSVIQMARAAGATTIVAVDIADDKLTRALELGATHIVNSLTVDAVAAVRQATGSGVDVAFEALGNPTTFRQASEMLADGGRMVAIGIAAGRSSAEIEITPLVRRGHTITGSFGGRTRADLPEVARITAAGLYDVEALVTRRFSLDDVDAAYQALGRGEITGRAIVEILGA